MKNCLENIHFKQSAKIYAYLKRFMNFQLEKI